MNLKSKRIFLSVDNEKDSTVDITVVGLPKVEGDPITDSFHIKLNKGESFGNRFFMEEDDFRRLAEKFPKAVIKDME
jgi:hypothetical protein